MQQKQIHLLACFLILVNIIHGQVDPRICPNGPISGIDARWPPIPSRFEVTSELISGGELAQLSQSFTAQRDAISINGRS